MNKQPKENIMAETKISPLIIKMSLPILLSLLVHAIYVLVDGYFISKLNADSFAGFGLSLPVLEGINAVCAGIGIGVNVNLSKALGEGDKQKTKAIVSNGIFLSFLIGIIIAIAGIFARVFFRFQTNNENIITEGMRFLLPLTSLSFIIIIDNVLNYIHVASGKTFLPSMVTIICSLLNIVFNYIFIFVLGWGILGAGIGNLLAFAISAIMRLYFNLTQNKEIIFKICKPNMDYISKIMKFGIPTFLTRALYPITALVANFVFIKFSVDALNVTTVEQRFESLTLAPIFAMNAALISIISFNLGQKSYKRVNETIKRGLIYSNILGILGFFAYAIFWRQMLAFHHATPEMFAIGKFAFIIIASNFILVGTRLTGTPILQSLGKPNTAMLILVIKQIVLIIPLLLIALSIHNLTLAFSAWLLSEIPAIIMTIWAIKKASAEAEV